MLRFLGVRNLSVIDHLEVEFEPGLNVLTGETGAGKSVLVDAIGLLVGSRASADLVRTGEDLATVQAIFELDGRDVIVRREISAQGRSRAFIDDSLATSTALRDLGTAVLELHGQHEHQTLLDPREHAGIVDAYACHDELRALVAERYAEWRAALDALERTKLSDRDKQARIEMATFQLQEIDKVAPRIGEDEQLAAEKTVLANADRLRRLSAEAYAALYDGESAVLPGLSVVFKRVTDLAALDGRFLQYVEQRDGLRAPLEDLAFFLRSYGSNLDASPDRLQMVEDRLAALERLKRRHGPGLDEVIARRQSLAAELESLDASEEQAAARAERERSTRGAFVDRASELGASRRSAADRLSKTLERHLHELAMPACRLEIRQRQLNEPMTWSAQGTDEIEIFISPNPGEELRPLARIASGGELSRIMLALRMSTLTASDPKTLIFDEVDAGIGGAAADAVGTRLQALGRRHQVVCVTHLAQIAARASTHFAIEKQVRSGRTQTTLTRLDAEGREVEIGRMIAGAAITPQVRASAREMLSRQAAGEDSAKGESESGPPAKVKGKRGGR